MTLPKLYYVVQVTPQEADNTEDEDAPPNVWNGMGFESPAAYLAFLDHEIVTDLEGLAEGDLALKVVAVAAPPILLDPGLIEILDKVYRDDD